MTITHSGKRRRKQPGLGSHIALALAAIATGLAIAWFAWIAPNVLPGLSHYTLKAEFERLAGLAPHNDVRIAGRRVGQVLNPRLEDGRVVLDLRLDADAGPLPADTTAVVRAQGLLGQRFLELRPGDSTRDLDDGATIAADQTRATVDLPEFLSAFDERRRDSLRSVVDEMGIGFAGRGGQVNEALGDLPSLLEDTRVVSDTILERDGAAARFFPSLRDAAEAADPVREEMTRGFAPQARGLRVLADNREAIQRFLDAAPPALAMTRDGLRGSQPLLVEAAGFARSARRTFARAPSGFRETQLLLAEGQGSLRRATPLLERLRAAIPPTVALTARLDPLLPPLRRALQTSRPGLDELASRPCDLSGWAENWRSTLEHGIPGGGDLEMVNTFRLTPIGTPESLQKAGQEASGSPIGSNPYPAPCEAGTEQVP